MSNLYRLVYSSFRNPECDDSEIRKILESCKRNNPGREVSGILIHSDSRFIQYLEGEEAELEKLFTLIQNDKRHSGVSRRNFEAIDERIFPTWAMGYKDLSHHEIDYYSDISDNDKGEFNELLKGDLDFTDSGIRLLQVYFKMR